MRTSRKMGLYATGGTAFQVFFDSGDQFTDVTGGWTSSGYSISNRSKYGTTTIGKTIYVYASGTLNAAIAGTVKAIDLSRFQKVSFNVTAGGHNSGIVVGVSSTKVVDTGSAASTKVTGTGLISVDVSSLSGKYYLYAYVINSTNSTTRTITIDTVYGHSGSDGPTGIVSSLSQNIPINDTYRHCDDLYTTDYVRVGSLGSNLQGINYVGEGTADYNAMMVPVSAFTFDGTSQMLSLALYLWTSSSSNHTFRWAVTTSRDNENLYKSFGNVNDPNQLAAGSFTPPYSGSPQWYTIDFIGCTVKSGTPLYIYLWRDNNTYGNIHVTNNVVVTLVYKS